MKTGRWSSWQPGFSRCFWRQRPLRDLVAAASVIRLKNSYGSPGRERVWMGVDCHHSVTSR